MAIENEILVGRFNKAVQKLCGMKGKAPAPQLSSDFQAVFPFFFGAENRFLESWDRFGVANTIAAQGAGNLSGTRFRNPAGSNTVIVVEKLSVTNKVGIADEPVVQIASGLADYATPVNNNGNRLDSRGRPNPTLVNSTGVGVSTGASMAQVGFPANGMAEFILTENQELPLLPNDTLNLITNAVNQSLVYTIFWRERFLEDSERA